MTTPVLGPPVDSLIIGNIFELLGGGVPSTHPQCAGAIFQLAPGWDLSSPQYNTSAVASLLLGGGLPIGQHVDNRSPALPIVITVPSTGNLDNDRTTLAGAREALTQAVSADRWTLVWTRQGAPGSLVFDCFHAKPVQVTYSQAADKALVCQIAITFDAMPYGRSDDVEQIPFNSPSTSWTPPPASIILDDFNTIDNWLGGDDVGFETSIGNWVSAGNVTLTRSTAQFHSGTASLLMASQAAGAMQAASLVATSILGALSLSVLPGDTVHAGGWFRTAVSARSCNVGVDFYDSTGAFISTLRGSNITDSTSAWTQATATVTAPAGAADARVNAQVLATAAANEQHFFDDANLDRGPIYSTTDLQQYVQSTSAAVGSRSLRWLRTAHDCPQYTHFLPNPVNITGIKKLAFYLGLGTNTFSQWNNGRVTAKITYGDTSGNTVNATITANVRASGLITAPRWQKLSGSIPQTTNFDYTNVAWYEIQVWNKVEKGNVTVLQSEAYFDTFGVHASSTGAPAARGATYAIPGAVGTAPAAITIQVQPGPSAVQQTAIFTTVGSNNWTAPVGVTSVQKAEGIAGGAGGAGAGSDAGAGGCGAEYAAEFNIPVTPSTVYHPIVGAGGTAGNTSTHTSGPGSNSSFIGDGGFGMLAHGATASGIGSSRAIGAAGSGSSNSVHYSGGRGYRIDPGINRGGGGGGSGGYAASGRDAPGPAGQEYHGAVAVDGGGNGGQGGFIFTPPLTGNVPASGFGGGGGGGAVDSVNSPHGGGAGKSGWVKLTWAATMNLPLKTVILHAPPRDAPASLATFIVTGNGADTPNGGTTYTAPVTGSMQARYKGTYQVILTNFSWSAPTTSRTITWVLTQHKGDGTTTSVTLTRTLTPNTDTDPLRVLNGLVALGTVNLPLSDISPGNNTDTFSITVNDTVTADRFLDTLLLDTTGQTMIYTASGSGVNNLWVTESDIGQDLGSVFGSAADWDTADSILQDVPVLSGGPIALLPGENPFTVYSVGGSPAVQASYQPRWNLERLQ